MPTYFETKAHGKLRVTNMFTDEGEETEDLDEAATVVCPLPNGEWLAVKVFTGELTETEVY